MEFQARKDLSWPAVILLVCSSSSALADEELGFCQGLLSAIGNRVASWSPSGRRERMRAILSGLARSHEQAWRSAGRLPPESLEGVTEEEAVALLRDFQRRDVQGQVMLEGATPLNEVVVAVPLASAGRGASLEGVIKKPTRTPTVHRDQIGTISTNPLYEVLAFALDRRLETNLVPPAVALTGGRSLQLRIRDSVPNKGIAMSFAPELAMEMSHLFLLDLLLKNPDRFVNEGNLRLSSDHRKPIAIDFDLSKPYLRQERASAGAPAHLAVVLEGKRVRIPLVVSETVYENLVALSAEQIRGDAAALGVRVQAEEINYILSARNGFLRAVDEAAATYGRENVFISAVP